jgi:hypothetical protein
MEYKLLELREQFCKWYCPNKDKIIDYECSGIVGCEECNEETECPTTHEIYVDLCDECQIEDFIQFARDEL